MIETITRRIRRTRKASFLTHGADDHDHKGANTNRRRMGLAVIAEQLNDTLAPSVNGTVAATLFRIVLTTQCMENYGAHCWDGVGECPQHWKYKGGTEYQQPIGDANDVLAMGQRGVQNIAQLMGDKVSDDSEGWREWPINWTVIPSTEESYEEKELREMLEEGYSNERTNRERLERLHQPTLS